MAGQESQGVCGLVYVCCTGVFMATVDLEELLSHYRAMSVEFYN